MSAFDPKRTWGQPPSGVTNGTIPDLKCDIDGVLEASKAVRRREFIAFVGSTAAVWPLAVRAQQTERVRRVGVLESAGIETDQQAGVAVFKEVLRELGWIDSRNVRVELRWAGADPAKARKDAEELVALQPDVIMVTGQLGLQTLLQTTRSVPIVFNSIADPVGSGYIDSLARPGGNATGFVLFDYALTAKWVELLKEIAPGVTRAAVLRDPTQSQGIGQFAVIQYVAPSVGMEVSAISMRDAREIEQDIAKFASSPNGGLILTASALAVVHRDLVVGLAAKHKLPAVYYRRYFVMGGGLMSYGSEVEEQFRGAARYVDRILKGEKPADLPVQAPTKYELVINRKTAQALGLTVPPSLLARADDVIE
jgi:putative tryptophan/tyrosine transport system substrate-binding protein